MDKTAGPREREAWQLLRAVRGGATGAGAADVSLPVERVRVRAPARLHFGVLDLRGAARPSFRRHGRLGAGARAATRGRAGGRLTSPRALTPSARSAFARRYGEAAGLPGGARIRIHPRDAGPQWARVGHPAGAQRGAGACRVVWSCRRSPRPWRDMVSRGARSGVGTWLFDRGGFVLEGGRREGAGVAPLLTRLPMPASWRCVVAVPASSPGSERRGRGRGLPYPARAPPEREVEHIAHLVLMQLLPALGGGRPDRLRGARWPKSSASPAVVRGQPGRHLRARADRAAHCALPRGREPQASDRVRGDRRYTGLAGERWSAAARLAGIAREHVGARAVVSGQPFANTGARGRASDARRHPRLTAYPFPPYSRRLRMQPPKQSQGVRSALALA